MCRQTVQEPDRTQIKIPQYIRDEYPFLAKPFKVKTRAIRNLPVAIQTKFSVKEEEIDDIDA